MIPFKLQKGYKSALLLDHKLKAIYKQHDPIELDSTDVHGSCHDYNQLIRIYAFPFMISIIIVQFTILLKIFAGHKFHLVQLLLHTSVVSHTASLLKDS